MLSQHSLYADGIFAFAFALFVFFYVLRRSLHRTQSEFFVCNGLFYIVLSAPQPYVTRVPDTTMVRLPQVHISICPVFYSSLQILKWRKECF